MAASSHAGRVGAPFAWASTWSTPPPLCQGIQSRPSILCADVAGIEEQFDVVASIEVLEHIPDEVLPGFVRAIAQRVAGWASDYFGPHRCEPVHRKHYRLTQGHWRRTSPLAPARWNASACSIYAPPPMDESIAQDHLRAIISVLEIPALNRRLWTHLWRNRVSTAGRAATLSPCTAGPGPAASRNILSDADLLSLRLPAPLDGGQQRQRDADV